MAICHLIIQSWGSSSQTTQGLAHIPFIMLMFMLTQTTLLKFEPPFVYFSMARGTKRLILKFVFLRPPTKEEELPHEFTNTLTKPQLSDKIVTQK